MEDDDNIESIFTVFEEEGPQPWLITFADMVSLLMAMFVLLYSLSSLDRKKFDEVMESVNKKLSGQQALVGQTTPTYHDESIHVPDHKKLLHDLNKFISDMALENEISVDMKGKDVILRVEGQSIFASGEVALDPKAVPVMDSLLNVFNEHTEYKINIQGHTDNTPISSARYPSNWELSAIRATTVLRYMLSKGIEADRMTATGYADVMPIAPNNSSENRSRNRRVEFVLEKKE